jgi:tripartite-type tricarboxylate transporter receptor subunit TctC
MNGRGKVRCFAMMGLFACAASIAAEAQTWPAKPVRIVIPFTPGGGSDSVGRILAQKLGETTGQSFVVENRPGAGGNIAFEFVAKADPDGYTLVNSPIGIVTNPSLFSKVNYRIEDFAAVTQIGEAPLLVVVNPALPVRSLAEFVKLAKARPGEVRFGSSGTGSSSHLASEVLRTMAGINIIHIPYRGGPQSLHDVIGGQVEMTTLPMPETLPQVRANRVRALGQTGLRRSSIAPDIPTLDEGGIKGYSVVTWYVVLVPVRTPAAVIGRIHAEIEKALNFPDVQERLKAAGVTEIVGAGPDHAGQFIKAEYARWAKVIQASGTKAE